jgi:hypothetical protein
MDPFIAVAAWVTAFLCGGITALGVARIMSGRVFFGSWGDRSAGEAKQLGWIQVVAGVSLGLFALLEGLGNTIPRWGRLVQIPLLFIFAGAMLFHTMIWMRRRNPGASAGRS